MWNITPERLAALQAEREDRLREELKQRDLVRPVAKEFVSRWRKLVDEFKSHSQEVEIRTWGDDLFISVNGHHFDVLFEDGGKPEGVREE